MREFEGIVAFRDNDLLQNRLKGYPDLAKGGRALFLEGPLHLGNKLVHRPRSSAVLEGLNCVEEPQVKDVGVWTVGRLVDEPDFPAVSRACGHDVRVVVNAVRRRVVLLDVNCSSPFSRPAKALMAGMTSSTTFLKTSLSHLHTLGLNRPSRPVPTVAQRGALFGERKDTELACEVAATAAVKPRPNNCCEKHHLCNVRFVLNFTGWQLLVGVQVVLLPVLANVKPLLVNVNEVFKAVDLVPMSRTAGDPSQRPRLVVISQQWLEKPRRST